MAIPKTPAAALLMAFAAMLVAKKPVVQQAKADEISPWGLTGLTREGAVRGACPLKHTDVRVDISGPVARVVVTQDYENPYPEAIEAVYTFPLSQNSAVDDMTMSIGERVVKGKIKPREEARRIYEDAKARGQLAGLLDQERPNIFTQAVANIPPGAKVKIEIRYVESLSYEAGSYSFGFPMVVGPRYKADARTAPPVAAKGTRAGHDISLAVKLDAGVPVESVASSTHEIDLTRVNAHAMNLKLRSENEIPNKDFLLKWDVAGRKISDALLTHHDSRGGFFTFLLHPPERVVESEITPKEIVFVLDTSGSMMGYPIEKAKEVIKLTMDGLHSRDTFNLITFAGDTHVLFPEPVKATPENVEKAQRFLLSRQGGGGTEMMKAIRAALDPSDSQEHVRIVCFLTDGYVGNDLEIVQEVKRHANARVFSMGIGSSVNRFLLDKMAEEGRGEVEYVGLSDDGSAAAVRLSARMRSPLLTDVEIDWAGLGVSDVYPKRLPDLFSAKPLVVKGRYAGAGSGLIRLKGKQAGRAFSREIRVDLPAEGSRHDALASLWARAKVDDLMSRSTSPAEFQAEIVQVGMEFRLLTQFTSFVAVEEKTVTDGGQPRRIDVPVEMPHGVSRQGVFGEREEAKSMAFRQVGGAATNLAVPVAPPVSRPRPIMEADVVLPDAQPSTKLAPELRGRTGAVKVKVWLSQVSTEVIGKLKAAGLQVSAQPGGAKLVLGSIDASKLEELAKVAGVTYISLDLGTP